MPVVVVESPAKAKTINKYLGNEYVVETVSVDKCAYTDISNNMKKINFNIIEGLFLSVDAYWAIEQFNN